MKTALLKADIYAPDETVPNDMNARKRPSRLLDVRSMAMEYAIVDRDSLEVRPLTGRIFADAGAIGDAILPRGTMAWRPTVAAHVPCLYHGKPARRSPLLGRRCSGEVRAMNTLLARHNAMLLPGGAHPFMDPACDTTLWSGPDGEIHALNDRIFGCRTHGWVNSHQATLTLHFNGDSEFGRLHAAIRLLLPIIPALSAASPILEGQWTGFLDARMEAYLHAREKHPECMGSLIPEAVFDQEAYYRQIFSPIAQAIAGSESGAVIDHELANDRGAVAHFDSGSIDIRVIDVQECPSADLAIAEFITEVLKALVGGRWVSTYLQRAWSENDLLAIFLQVIKDAGGTVIANRDYLLMFGMMKQDQMSASKLWQHLFVELYDELSEECRTHIGHILEHGCLASRILARTGKRPDRDRTMAVYRDLAQCLAEERPFV